MEQICFTIKRPLTLQSDHRKSAAKSIVILQIFQVRFILGSKSNGQQFNTDKKGCLNIETAVNKLMIGFKTIE